MKHQDIEDALLEGARADVQGIATCDACNCAIEDDGSHLCPRCQL